MRLVLVGPLASGRWSQVPLVKQFAGVNEGFQFLGRVAGSGAYWNLFRSHGELSPDPDVDGLVVSRPDRTICWLHNLVC